MVMQIKDEMAAAGKLEYDWRAAKARKAERKLLEQTASGAAFPA